MAGAAPLKSKGPFFAQVWECVLFDPEVNGSALKVYAVLQRYAAWYGSHAVFPSQEQIAARANMNRETVNNALQLLLRRGHISREKNGKGWVVIINAPTPWDPDGISDTKDVTENPAERDGISDTYVTENPTRNAGKSDTIKERETLEKEENPPTPLSGGKPPRKQPKKSLVPDPFDPGMEEWDRMLEETGKRDDWLNLHTDQFLDYWKAQGGMKVDWIAAWRVWIRKEAQGRQR